MFLFFTLFFIVIVSGIYVSINFLYYITGNVLKNNLLWRITQLWVIAIVPIGFLLLADFPNENECCGESAVFSPNHRHLIYTLIGISIIAYVISIFRKNILPPIPELFLQSFLLLGFILNIIIAIHLHTAQDGPFYWIVGNIPILFLYIISILENHKKLKDHINNNKLDSSNLMGKLAQAILNSKAVYKYPILTLCLIPFIIFLSLFLILFGQKPDSIIRAFTDTYKHGFSELDYMCDNVRCGEHFLCSVGANGHKSIVKPIRYGERHGNRIICNRQLLIANAFEDLIQNNLPLMHKLIRKLYNNVGKTIHKYYYLFDIKYVSDVVYILMKPLEFLFIIILYTFDSSPESRINLQYLNLHDQRTINKLKKENY